MSASTRTHIGGMILAAVFAWNITAAGPALGADKKATSKKTSNGKKNDKDMKLEGGQEGTIFKSLRIEGEDRIRIEFERPTLNINLDFKDAPGLEWEGIHTALERDGFDLMSPYIDRTAQTRPPRFARPWLQGFSTGPVARFRPNLEGVDRWKLVVANSRGETVTSFEGKGKPPKEIPWDGRTAKGEPAPPGFTYSYVLEATDKAGNMRNFVGDGFELPSYRVKTEHGFAMLFAGTELATTRTPQPGGTAPAPAVVLEAATWINQNSSWPVHIEVTARTYDQAQAIAGDIEKSLGPLLLGDPMRVKSTANVFGDAPDAGTIAISVSLSEPSKRNQKSDGK